MCYFFLSQLKSRAAGENAEDQGESSFVLNDPTGKIEFLPFGFGARACVGQKFIIQGVATLFASLLANYEVGWLVFLYAYVFIGSMCTIFPELTRSS